MATVISNEQFKSYSFIRFRSMLSDGVKQFGYTALARKSGVARSTLSRLVKGEITDVKLSTAQCIQIAIFLLKRKRLT